MAGNFTSSNSYSVSGRTFSYDKNNLYVKQGLSLIATHSYTNVDLAVRRNGSNYEVGSMSFNPAGSFFTVTVPYTNAKAGIVYEPSTNKIIGSTDTSDDSVTKETFNIGGTTGAVILRHNTTTHNLTITCANDPADGSGNPKNPNYEKLNP
jgi:hypothetical protein